MLRASLARPILAVEGATPMVRMQGRGPVSCIPKHKPKNRQQFGLRDVASLRFRNPPEGYKIQKSCRGFMAMPKCSIRTLHFIILAYCKSKFVLRPPVSLPKSRATKLWAIRNLIA